MGHNFRELKIWQKEMDLVDCCYDFTAKLPKDEKYNLISQINRCACSIPTNIAEGCGKRSANHFAEFLSTSLGSCFELETHVEICRRRKYVNSDETDKINEKILEVRNMIFRFREKIISEKKS